MASRWAARSAYLARPSILLSATLPCLLAALVVSLFPGAPGGAHPSAPAAPTAGPVSVATRSLAAAEASLNTGPHVAGPAGACGGPAHACGASGSSQNPRPSAGGSSPVWTNITSKLGGNYPSNRWLASMVYDPVDRYVVLFGGYAGGSPFSDTWTYANGAWNQLTPNNNPTGRYAATMTWDAKDGYVVLFSGYTTTAVLNDTWTFLHGQWTDVTNTSDAPPARWRAVMAYDPVDQYVVMFGGSDSTGTTIFSDTWAFSGGNWTKLTVNGNPPGHYRAEATWDASDGYLVMFGGCTSSTCPTSDTWKYVDKNWTSVTPATRPSARTYVGITYDQVTRNVTTFGGTDQSTNFYSDTWQFHNGTWTSLTETRHPGGRAYTALTYDALDGYVLLFGGAPSGSGGYQNDTWVFGPSVLGALRAAPGAIDLGQTVALNATAISYSGYVTYTWSSLPGGCFAGNVSVVLCTPNATGNFEVNVSETDSTGVPATKNVTFAVNGDPAITRFAASRPIVTVGTSTLLNVTTNGAGTAPYSFVFPQLPPGCASRNSSSISCAPNRAGTFWVNVTLTDMAGWHDHASLNLTVNPRPSLLGFTASPPTVDAGFPVTFYANATGGTPPLTYSYSGLPTPCVTQSTATLVCRPGNGTGFTTVTVLVTDAFGWNASASTPLTVNPGVTAGPLGISARVIDAHQSVTFWLNASGGTGGLTYSYSGQPGGCVLAPTARATCAPTATGNFTVTGTARDTVGETVNVSVDLTVNPDVNVTGLLVTPAALDVNQVINITASVTGGTAPITYTYSGLPSGCVSVDLPSFTCTPNPTKTGAFTLRVDATDLVGRTSGSTTQVRINPDPSVQSFTTSDPSVTSGTTVSFTVTASGGTGTLSYSYSGLPQGCGSSNSSTLTCQPSQTGSFNVAVFVKDSVGRIALGHTTLNVTAPPSSSGLFGLSGSTGYLLLGALVAVVAVAVVVALVVRRGRGGARQPPAPWSEEEPSDPSSSE